MAGVYDDQRIFLLLKKEQAGIRAYENGDHDKAFDALRETAPRGLKESQYVMSLMFMQGHGTERSVLIGLGWLGVAIESGNPDWQATFDNIAANLSDAQRAMVDVKVSEYIEKYGTVTQGVTCQKRTSAGSRSISRRCDKIEGSYPDYEIETQATQ